MSARQGISRSAVEEIQLLFHNLHRRQHRQPAKPQEHDQMVRDLYTLTHARPMILFKFDLKVQKKNEPHYVSSLAFSSVTLAIYYHIKNR